MEVDCMKPRIDTGLARVYHGSCLEILPELPAESVHCCVTSPPYWGLRDYGSDGQLGLEETPEEYVANMVAVFREVRRVLRGDGTLWLNLGDSYATGGGAVGRCPGGGDQGERFLRAGMINTQPNRMKLPGLKPKDLVGIPWRVAFALQSDGWYLRQDIVWSKPNPMPESVRDRCTKSHEYIFLLTKSPRYYYDAVAIAEPSNGWPIGGAKTRGETGYAIASGVGKNPQRDSHGGLGGDGDTRNRRSVWTVATKPYGGAHFAVFPPDLIEPCILAGTSNEGCCKTCGAPWRRVTESERVATRPGTGSKVYDVLPLDESSPHQKHNGDICGNRDPQRHVTKRRTIDWAPSCECNAGKTPCVVLDPFTGSGTTAEVSIANGRHFVGCELNPDYFELIDNRQIRQGVMF